MLYIKSLYFIRIKRLNKLVWVLGGTGMQTKFSTGDIFHCGRTYTTVWKVVRIKLIFNVVHYELEETKTPKRVMLSEWALVKDKNWIFVKKATDESEDTMI